MGDGPIDALIHERSFEMENPTIAFVGPRQVQVLDQPVPRPGPGELLIETHRTLISTGTELSVLDGNRPTGKVWSRLRDYPAFPGYDNVGTVVDVGSGVDPSWVGKRVSGHGRHAAYVAEPVALTWEVAEGVSDEEAVFLTLAQIALNGVRRSGLVFGEVAVVYGLGMLGQITGQLCQFAGSRPVIGVDVCDFRAELLPQREGIVGVVATQRDVQEAVAEATNGRMADVVFELTGNPDVIPEEFKLLRRMGRCVLVSSPRGPTLFDFHDLCNSPSYTIIGAHNSSHPEYATGGNPWTKARHAELFFDLVAGGDLDVARLVTHRASFEQAPGLYAMLLEDRTRAMGVVMRWRE
jgi:2-desacetyl-2-hydroxyethyl bacteriochlorophyllide A dehydrogenase